MDQQWVIVRKCRSLQEAEFLKSVLEGDGIPALIPTSTSWGLIRVLVSETDRVRAFELLDSAKPAEESVDED